MCVCMYNYNIFTSSTGQDFKMIKKNYHFAMWYICHSEFFFQWYYCHLSFIPYNQNRLVKDLKLWKENNGWKAIILFIKWLTFFLTIMPSKSRLLDAVITKQWCQNTEMIALQVWKGVLVYMWQEKCIWNYFKKGFFLLNYNDAYCHCTSDIFHTSHIPNYKFSWFFSHVSFHLSLS